MIQNLQKFGNLFLKIHQTEEQTSESKLIIETKKPSTAKTFQESQHLQRQQIQTEVHFKEFCQLII